MLLGLLALVTSGRAEVTPRDAAAPRLLFGGLPAAQPIHGAFRSPSPAMVLERPAFVEAQSFHSASGPTAADTTNGGEQSAPSMEGMRTGQQEPHGAPTRPSMLHMQFQQLHGTKVAFAALLAAVAASVAWARGRLSRAAPIRDVELVQQLRPAVFHVNPVDRVADVPLESYSEESRKFRRNVYSHESWEKHRDSNRFFRNFRTFLDSGVVRSLYMEIAFVTAIALFVVLANMGVAGYDDFTNVHHAGPFANALVKEVSLPALPFSIAMPALSLLLVFRTNTAYFRWNEARTLWGGIVNTTRNLQRQSNAYFSEDAGGQELREELTNQVALFPKALRSFLRGVGDDPIFKEEATRLVGAEAAEALMVSKNRPTFVCNMISATVQRADIHPMDRARMDECTSKLVDQLGACERIFRSPIPLVYTRHTNRFITCFMALLPLALWGPMKDTWNHWATIPATALLGLFLFGIEELGIQIEEPFGILPLEALCDGSIEGVVMDMRNSYTEGYFGGLDTRDPAPDVASVYAGAEADTRDTAPTTSDYTA
jgi:predicted membrane chloride channel (bestrophin family)